MKPGRDEITLDDAIAAVRDHEAPAGVAEAAGARVWERLAPHEAGPVQTIRGCADVQALLPAHRRGALAGPRALLIEDHLRECAACRAAFRQPGGKHLAILPWRPAPPVAKPEPRGIRPYAVAASIMLAAGLSAWWIRQAVFVPSPGPRATVQSVSGGLHRVAVGQSPALSPGEEVGEGDAVRTARGSRAVLRLRDGSILEMSERAELSLTARGKDTTIHLERGRIIVEAAKRRTGHLLVASNDCTVYVTGTVFSVNRGIKGSRVSVLEGQVRVVQGGDEKVLAPGQQLSTSGAMGAVPLREEISWSGDLDRHLTLLAEVRALREKWNAVPMPGVRHQSRLLGIIPEDTLIFASIPNYGETLAEAHRLFEERLQESSVLREWWREADPARHGGPSLATVIEKVRSFAGFLGDEIVLAAVDDGRYGVRPLVLAEVRRPGLREFLEGELAAIESRPDHGPAVRILGEDVPAAPAAGKADVFVLLRPDLIVVTADPQGLQALASRLDGGGLGRTPFGARIAEAYDNGVGLLFAADLERFTARHKGGRDRRGMEALQRSGLDGLRHLIVERKDLAGHAHTQAVLALAGAPRGIPSWLAAPAPMGSLDFVSPNAQAAAAFVSKSPSLVLDEIVTMAGANDPLARERLAELESKLNLRVREDLALTLGGEFAMALDGPILPTPSWKVVVEVYDPARLQASLQVLVAKANDEAVRANRPGLVLESEQVGAHTYHAVRGGLPFEVHYAFADGYLVAAPSRALVMRAIQTRESGESLGRSAAFRVLFPPDRDAHVSGLVYQNFGPVVGALLDASGSAQLSPDQRRSIESLARDSKPTLLCAYGEERGIRVAATGGFFDLDPADLALPMLLERAMPGTRRRATP